MNIEDMIFRHPYRATPGPEITVGEATRYSIAKHLIIAGRIRWLTENPEAPVTGEAKVEYEQEGPNVGPDIYPHSTMPAKEALERGWDAARIRQCHLNYLEEKLVA